MVTVVEFMDMIEVARKRANLSAEEFAVSLGITSTTHSRIKHGKQEMGITALGAYARFARETKNEELMTALASIALGVEPEQVKFNLS